MFGLGGALVFSSPRYLIRVVNALVTASLAGTIIYWIVPSLGPYFYSETAALFDRMPDNPLLKEMLLRQLLATMESPENFHVTFGGGIAAFPSLHITFSTILLFFLWSKHRILTVLLLFPFSQLVVSTVYLGWHYAFDSLGGIVLAWIVITLIECLEVSKASMKES
ncbi:MAG: phosphatase PAP2 family protein [bacterium]|nr:phosphatase PAP2 family protein [bacterium]MDT8396239.1 phosphatase PAP2 family protein [bacterium]